MDELFDLLDKGLEVRILGENQDVPADPARGRLGYSMAVIKVEVGWPGLLQPIKAQMGFSHCPSPITGIDDRASMRRLMMANFTTLMRDVWEKVKAGELEHSV